MGSEHITWESGYVPRTAFEQRNGHRAAVVWLTGLSGSGKSTIATAAQKALFEQGYQTFVLDGDNVRHGLCGDLGFSTDDRTENTRRVGEVAKLFYESGSVVLCAFISPTIAIRQRVRDLLPEGAFHEVFVDAPIEACIERDPKGLYKKAVAGEIKHFTGISAPFEAPPSPELHIQTAEQTLDESVARLVAYLGAKLKL
ncbi:MAG: adenylyl-sulfate kinase [Bacteroidota bacterium]